MAILPRPQYRTSVWMSLIVLCLLSACGTPPPTPTTPPSSAPSAQPSSQPSPSASPAPSPSPAESPAASPAPSAAPASPAPAQPSPQPSPTTQADLTQPDTHPPTVGAFYLWPVIIPDGFEIRPETASADENSFSIEIGGMGGQSPSAKIVGGKTSPAATPPTGEGQRAEIIVRTTKGMAYEQGAGYSIYWEEQGVPYAIIGDLSLDQAIALADSLQSTDLATWQANLDALK